MKKTALTILLAAALLLTSCGTKADGSAGARGGAAIEASAQTAVADTEYGKVAGFRQDGLNIFKGIPYAKAGRFMAPEAPDSWEGVRSCRAFGPTCPQDKRQGWQNDEIAFAFD